MTIPHNYSRLKTVSFFLIIVTAISLRISSYLAFKQNPSLSFGYCPIEKSFVYKNITVNLPISFPTHKCYLFQGEKNIDEYGRRILASPKISPLQNPSLFLTVKLKIETLASKVREG